MRYSKSKEIKEVLINSATAKYQQVLEATRNVWGKYHDGQAPVNTAKIDKELKKLVGKGIKVSYWINEVSPGSNSEY